MVPIGRGNHRRATPRCHAHHRPFAGVRAREQLLRIALGADAPRTPHNPPIRQILGQYIAVIALRGLTQAALAERAGVNRVTVAAIETGRKQGSVATLHKLADALGVAVDDLVG